MQPAQVCLLCHYQNLWVDEVDSVGICCTAAGHFKTGKSGLAREEGLDLEDGTGSAPEDKAEPTCKLPIQLTRRSERGRVKKVRVRVS